MSINDEWVRYLRSSGYTGSINDMIRADLQAQTGSSSKHLNTLWVEYLRGEGYYGHINDMMYQWLGSKGYAGNLNDRLLAALKADDVFDPISILFDAGVNGRLSDSSVETDLMYVRRFDTASIGVGRVQKNGKSTEFRLRRDDDNRLGITLAYAGESAFLSYLRPTLSDGFVTANPPNVYTTTIGSTFSFSFKGTGFSLRHYADDRGGVWRFTVDGVDVASVSTFSSTIVSPKLSPVVSGLDDVEHTVVATFEGDDPLNPPSGGTSRGWIYIDLNDGGTIPASSFALEGDDYRGLDDSSRVEVMKSSVVELAFSQTPTGSGFAADWFPAHGSAGALRYRTSTLHVDGVEYDSDPTVFIGRVNFSESVVLTETFTAFSPSDSAEDYPLAAVTIKHTFTRSGLQVFVDVVWDSPAISTGYVAMLPGNIATLPVVLTSEGYKSGLTTPPGPDTVTTGLDLPSNFMFVDTATGHGIALQTDKLKASDNGDWSGGTPPAFYTETPTGIAKCYIFAAQNRSMPSGERISVTNRYAIVAGATFPAGFEVTP